MIVVKFYLIDRSKIFLIDKLSKSILYLSTTIDIKYIDYDLR